MNSRSLPLLLLTTFLAVAPAWADVLLGISPAPVAVEPLEVFDVDLVVAGGGDPFNAYEFTLTYDPSVLTFIERSAAEQEGPLMTGACGTRWHVFDETGGTITLTHALLCAGTSVTGPGTVYRLRFQAADTTAVTWLEFPAVQFANAGIDLASSAVDAQVTVGSTLDVPGGAPGRSTLLLRAFPNPARVGTSLRFALTDAAPVQLEVFDTLGRSVRLLREGMLPAGDHEARWDRRDDRGSAVPAGLYFIRLRAGNEQALRRIVVLP